MGNKSDPKAGATVVPPPRIGKREGENEDEQEVNAKKQKRDEVAEEKRNKDESVSDYSFADFEPDKAGATAVPPSRIGKREGENEDEQEVNAKKQKRDEVAEEKRNKDESVSDYSFADFEPDKAGTTAVPPPRIGKREGENEDEQEVNAKKQKRDEVAEEKRNKDESVSDYSFADFEPDKAGTTAVPPPRIGKREGENEDEQEVNAKKQKGDEVAEEKMNKDESVSDYSFADFEPDKAGATAVPPPRIGKREGENEDEQEVNAKKQKRDEVAEEKRNKDESVSDYSFADFEPDKNPEAKMDSLSKQEEGKPDSAKYSSCLEISGDGSEENEGNLDIDEGDNSEEYTEETQEKMEVVPVKSSENSEEGIEEKDSKTPQENPKLLATPNERYAGSNTIVTRNLSYSVERADLENLFKACGEIVDVRLHTDDEGRFRGFGHVEFATAEAAQKALQLNYTELLRCRIRVCLAPQKHNRTPIRSFHVNSSCLSHSFQRTEGTQVVKGLEVSGDCGQETETKIVATCKEQSAIPKTIFVRNLSYSTEQDDIEYLFKDCGEIVSIRLHTDHNGCFKGYGHVEFATMEAVQKALELNNKVYLGRCIGVFIAKGKGEYASSRSNWSKSFHNSEITKPIKSTESSEYCKEEVEEKASNSYWESSKKLATLKEQNAPPKTIYVRNLSYRVDQADMENLFKECGKIVNVRLHRGNDGRLNGFGHVEFATAEAAKKALELHKTEFLGRTIGVYLSYEKSEYTYSRSNWSNSFQKCERDQSSTVFVAGFDCSLPAEKIKAILEEHFGSCGEIGRISVPKFPDSGAVKGYAHLEFKDVVSVWKALRLHQNEVGGFHLRVEKARPRHDNQGIGSGSDGGGHQFGGRDASGYTSRVSWGRSGGGGGWHSLYFSDEETGVSWGRSGGGGGWHSLYFSDEETGRKNHY